MLAPGAQGSKGPDPGHRKLRSFHNPLGFPDTQSLPHSGLANQQPWSLPAKQAHTSWEKLAHKLLRGGRETLVCSCHKHQVTNTLVNQ